jgi:hypothetical protein
VPSPCGNVGLQSVGRVEVSTSILGVRTNVMGT